MDRAAKRCQQCDEFTGDVAKADDADRCAKQGLHACIAPEAIAFGASAKVAICGSDAAGQIQSQGESVFGHWLREGGCRTGHAYATRKASRIVNVGEEVAFHIQHGLERGGPLQARLWQRRLPQDGTDSRQAGIDHGVGHSAFFNGDDVCQRVQPLPVRLAKNHGVVPGVGVQQDHRLWGMFHDAKLPVQGRGRGLRSWRPRNAHPCSISARRPSPARGQSS